MSRLFGVRLLGQVGREEADRFLAMVTGLGLARGDSLLLDLAGAGYLHPRVVRWLGIIGEVLARRGGRLEVAGASDEVGHIISVSSDPRRALTDGDRVGLCETTVEFRSWC